MASDDPKIRKLAPVYTPIDHVPAPPRRRPSVSVDVARRTFERRGFNPLDEMILLAQSDLTRKEDKVALLKELAKYYAPTLKSMDLKAEMKSDVVVRLVHFSKLNQSLAQIDPEDEEEDEEEREKEMDDVIDVEATA